METYRDLLEAFEAYLYLRNFRPGTHRSYLSSLKLFFKYRRVQRWQGEFTVEQVRSYLVSRHRSDVSWITVNIDYSAIKMFYVEVLKLTWDIVATPRPKTLRQLPRILSKEEIQRVIFSARNLKSQTFMLFLYGTGLRISEALAVKLVDINSDRLQLRVQCGKGGKDRYVAMPVQLVPILRAYYKVYRPSVFLFSGEKIGSSWKMRSAQIAIKKAAQQAGISKAVTAHVFRHCYATHHLENGTNLLFLKKQLGHKDLKTTQQYLHLCTLTEVQVHHPLAKLEIKLLQTRSAPYSRSMGSAT
ncbi:MAG: site-specific integrase [Saprospiraceae bacterium]|nr:site-specific integrase [Saprospiraceae bacterium]